MNGQALVDLDSHSEFGILRPDLVPAKRQRKCAMVANWYGEPKLPGTPGLNI